MSNPLASGTRARIPTCFCLACGKKASGGALPEAVEDDLHRLNIGILNRLKGLFDLLNTDSVVADLAGLDQVVEDCKHFRAGIKLGGRAMKLKKIKSFAGEIAQTVFDPRRKILAAVSCNRLARKRRPALVATIISSLPALLELCDEALASAIAIDIRGVEEIDSGIDGLVQSRQRILVRNMAPGAANRPRAKADLCNFPTGATQQTVVHRGCFPVRDGFGFCVHLASPRREYKQSPERAHENSATRFIRPRFRHLSVIVESHGYRVRQPDAIASCQNSSLGAPMKDEVVLVTGASGGLGVNVTQAFLDAGATVIGTSRKIHQPDFNSANFAAIPAEISTREGAKILVDQVVAHFGKLNIMAHTLVLEQKLTARQAMFQDIQINFDVPSNGMSGREAFGLNLRAAAWTIEFDDPHLQGVRRKAVRTLH